MCFEKAVANCTAKSAPDEMPEQLMPEGSMLSTGASGGSVISVGKAAKGTIMINESISKNVSAQQKSAVLCAFACVAGPMFLAGVKEEKTSADKDQQACGTREGLLCVAYANASCRLLPVQVPGIR